ARARALVPGLLHRAAAQVAGAAPETMADAGAADVLERAVTLLRGNRSSSIVTFVDDDGALRVLPRAERLVALARRLDRLALAPEDPRARHAARLAEVLVRAPYLPAPLAGGLALLDVQRTGADELHLVLGHLTPLAPLARLALRPRAASPFALEARLVPVARLDDALSAQLRRLAARLARATTEPRWRAALALGA
ncbi:MAG: hypothetical protein KF729_36600, partial [Sandaracinaceae bacterium]|nr:hypothetical protein [Sandaracinaceae bacterium]